MSETKKCSNENCDRWDEPPYDCSCHEICTGFIQEPDNEYTSDKSQTSGSDEIQIADITKFLNSRLTMVELGDEGRFYVVGKGGPIKLAIEIFEAFINPNVTGEPEETRRKR